MTNSLPVAAIANLLGVGERRVQQLARAGVLPRASRGRYPIPETVQSYTQYLRNRIDEVRAAAQPHAQSRAAATRLKQARAEREELRLAKERGELLPVGDVEASVLAMISAVRQRLLGVPTKAGPLAYAAETAAEAVQVVRLHIFGALEELAGSPYAHGDKDPIEMHNQPK